MAGILASLWCSSREGVWTGRMATGINGQNNARSTRTEMSRSVACRDSDYTVCCDGIKAAIYCAKECIIFAMSDDQTI